MEKKFWLMVLSGILIFSACEKQSVDPDPDVALKKGVVDELGPNSMHDNGKMVLNFRAHLSGDQEVHDVETQATGQAIFKLSKDGEELSYKIMVANLENVFMGHIHVAPAGVNGPVAVWLYPSAPPPQLISGVTNGILVEGVITESDLVGPLAGQELSDLIDLMVEGMTYVNIHTTQYPAGEIRGQIKGNVKME